MAKYIGPRCRIQRRLGADLALKRFRPFSKKERDYPPGQHGTRRRRRPKDYGIQLVEKQKARAIYGVLERQFRIYYKKAAQMRGVTGENLLQLLESRLDNVVFRMGVAVTRAHGRQLVRHGHVLVNGRRVDIPSAQVKIGDKIELKENSREIQNVQMAWNMAEGAGYPAWITRDVENFSAVLDRLPTVPEMQLPVNETLIVEYYSR